MLNKQTIRYSLTAVLALCVGCQGSDSITPAATLDLNAALSQTIIGDINAIPGAQMALGVPTTPAMPAFDPSQCPFSSTRQSFVCPSRTSGGLTYSLEYYLYDASGHSLSQADLARTASLRSVVDVTGTQTGSVITGTGTFTSSSAFNHHSDMTLSGLLGTARTLNGTSRSQDVVTSTGGIANVRTTIDLTGTTANLVLPSGSSKWPAAGTITTVANTSVAEGFLPIVNSTMNGVLTFNGTSTATLTTSLSGHVRTCQIDLALTAPPRCS